MTRLRNGWRRRQFKTDDCLVTSWTYTFGRCEFTMTECIDVTYTWAYRGRSVSRRVGGLGRRFFRATEREYLRRIRYRERTEWD